MALLKCKLGDHVALVERPNTELRYGLNDVRGVNNQKLMIRTKADMSGRKLDKFQIVLPGEFFFNHRTSRNGSKFSVTFNYDKQPRIVTEDYVVFRVLDDGAIDPMWLYMYFCRPEFDRYVIQNSWGSSTEFFNWNDLCDTVITLPPLDVQKRFALVFEALRNNQRSYERGLSDLKLSCDAHVEMLLHSNEKQKLGRFIELVDKRNQGTYGVDAVRGLSTGKELIDTKANMDGVSIDSYKIFEPGNIAYVADTSRRGDKISLAMNTTETSFLLSSISIVFRTCNGLLPDYLMLFFTRAEFDRYARFNSWGSARETFDWDDMCDVEIPIPDIQTQQVIAGIYRTYIERKRINESLKRLLSGLFPILIKGSIEEAGV